VRAPPPEVLAGIQEKSSWEQVIANQPGGRGVLSEAELDEALALIGDYADLKSPWFTDDSPGVPSLAARQRARLESGRRFR